jgi:carbamoyl-phosphate synthase large subunit
MNVLITSAGRRVSLVRAFKTELQKYYPDGKVFAADYKPELSAACRISDGSFQVVKVTDSSYCERLAEFCLSKNIKLIIPTIDTELIPLSKNINLFLKIGIQPVVSSIEMVKICRNKRNLLHFFDSIGFPRTQEVDVNNPEFPVFAKPLDGSSSIGARVLNNQNEMENLIHSDEQVILLKYFNPSEFSEYTVDMYFDRYHKLICAVPRERLEVRSGEVSKSVTRKDDLYTIITGNFSNCSGFIGCITLQVFMHRTSLNVFGIEINPRFGGGYPLSYLAGANYPEYLIKEYLLNQQISFFDAWAENMLMLRYDDEIIIHDYKS